jgi:hypothetical protein
MIGLQQDQIAQKIICFGVDGINVYQNIKNGVTK